MIVDIELTETHAVLYRKAVENLRKVSQVAPNTLQQVSHPAEAGHTPRIGGLWVRWEAEPR